MSSKNSINAKANLIWEVATKLVGVYKPHEYGDVILPLTVLKRFDEKNKTKGHALNWFIKQKIEDIMSLGYTKEEVIKMTKSLPALYVPIRSWA